jgi:prepilin-type N-terminal cleavage/methylation domain-containing protein
MNYKNKKQGFTLIELMVAVGLMALIMGIVGMVFRQTSGVFKGSDDEMTIYRNARATLDQLEVDLLGCLPLDINLQRFSLEEGKYLPMPKPNETTARAEKTMNPNDVNADAMDKINLRTFTSAGGIFQGVDITYVLGEECDPTILAETGGTGKTLKTKRQLYALYRIPKAINKDGTTGSLIGDSKNQTSQELEAAMAFCHYVLSFNIEYFDTTRKQFRQVSDHKKDPITNRDIFEWPIGDNNPPGEQLHRALRIVLRVVADAAERKERIFPRTIWIPVGY